LIRRGGPTGRSRTPRVSVAIRELCETVELLGEIARSGLQLGEHRVHRGELLQVALLHDHHARIQRFGLLLQAAALGADAVITRRELSGRRKALLEKISHPDRYATGFG